MRVRFWGTRGSMPVSLTWHDLRDRLAQALVAANGRGLDDIQKAAAFVERANDLMKAGRPSCPVCSRPMDPEGHVCPRSNGHVQH